MSRRPKCAFTDCDNEVMKGPETGRLLSVCQECFDRNRAFENMQYRPSAIEIMCPGCMVTLDIPFNEKMHNETCPSCGLVMEVVGEGVTTRK